MKSRFAVVCAVLAVVTFSAAWWSGATEALSRPETIRAWILSAGIWGPLAYISLAMALFTVFLLAPPVWASVTIWPAPEAFAYSLAASVLASLATYAVSRRWGADWAEQHLPDKLRPWEARVRTRPFVALFTLRLLFWANPMVDLFAAVLHVPAQVYLLTTVIGLAIATAGQIAIGLGGSSLIGLAPWWVWVSLGLIGGGGTWLWRRRKLPPCRQ